MSIIIGLARLARCGRVHLGLFNTIEPANCCSGLDVEVHVSQCRKLKTGWRAQRRLIDTVQQLPVS